MKREEAHTLLEVMAIELTGELANSERPVTERTKLLDKQLKAIDMAIEALSAEQEDEPKFYDEDDYWNDRVSIHDRLINASWVINKIHKNVCDMCEQGIDIEDCNDCKIEKIKRIIYSAPIVQVDRPHGEWICHEIKDTSRWIECSNCHKEYPNIEMNFCPNCRADMRQKK